MINRLRLIKKIGPFDYADQGANLELGRLTLICAENGRGKTMLADILRSLATGDPGPIVGRRRLGATEGPHVIVECAGGPPPAIFENGSWNRTFANMVIFDDIFVERNVYSGLSVEPGQRQNLHELILGAQAVALSQRWECLVARIEEHNSALRRKEDAIPAGLRGTLSLDGFCALEDVDNIDAAIRDAERGVAAAREQQSISETAGFTPITLPAFDVENIDRILQQDLPSLDAAAAGRVQAHLDGLGDGGEMWVADGMQRLSSSSDGGAADEPCPFCAQNLDGSPIISHYRTYFSAEYEDLKRSVVDALSELGQAHGEDAQMVFERAVNFTGNRKDFWSRFCEMPDVALDTANIALSWRTAREAVAAALLAKQAAPLDRTTLPAATRAAVEASDANRQEVERLNALLQAANESIRVVKDHAAVGNLAALVSNLERLRATKARYDPPTAALCDEYLAERAAKDETVRQREAARDELNELRANVFTEYEERVNYYLEHFGTGFRLGSLTSSDTRGGPTSTYGVCINGSEVPVAGATSPDEPSFRNTLSAGDRSALALAFFLTSLDRDADLADKTVVIDDPISSLDKHRECTTVQEIRNLVSRAAQLIVLSHGEQFLVDLWESSRSLTESRFALHLVPEGSGSKLDVWDVEAAAITLHDHRHAMLCEYRTHPTQNNRPEAEALRLVLEHFVRAAYPDHFKPSDKIGQFLVRCRERLGTPEQILIDADVRELRDLLEYAGKFHHDTNPRGWQTQTVNVAELVGFVDRTLAFTRRPNT